MIIPVVVGQFVKEFEERRIHSNEKRGWIPSRILVASPACPDQRSYAKEIINRASTEWAKCRP